MREGFTPEIVSLPQDEDGLRYALKHVYDRTYVVPSTGWIVKYPQPGMPGDSDYDAARPRKHYQSLAIEDQYAPLLSDMLDRNWPLLRTDALATPKSARIEGHYWIDGQVMDVEMQLERKGSTFAPSRLNVHPVVNPGMN